MRKIILFLSLVAAISQSEAQVCTPQWSGTGSGIEPDTTVDLPAAVINQPYSAQVNFKTPAIDSSQGFPLMIDYITLLGVTGLSSIPGSVPFVYNCNPPTCQFDADSTGCVSITGTPNTIGTYPLIINAEVHLVGGLAVPYDVPGYQIVVGTGIFIQAIVPSKFEVFQNLPNPVRTSTEIQVLLPRASSIEFKVANVLGNVVFKKSFAGKQGKNIINYDASGIQPGVYFYTVTDGKNMITKRMVVEKK